MVQVGAAQLRADASEELGETEWLRHVVDRTGVEADDDVDLFLPRGEHQDREGVVGRAHLPADFEAIDVGQPEVEEHEVRVEGKCHRVRARRGPRRDVAVRGERAGEVGRDALVVLDDEDPLSHQRDARPRGGRALLRSGHRERG